MTNGCSHVMSYDMPHPLLQDPKEYLPFLNELQKLPLHYQRYKIDMHLQRYRKALANISLCGEITKIS